MENKLMEGNEVCGPEKKMPAYKKPVVDEWTETWAWAGALWGTEEGFTAFFRGIARQRAEAEGWQELGSSDVWHASYCTVKQIKALGTVTTREGLMTKVRDYMGVC